MTTPEDRDLWERDEEALRNEVRQLNATLDRAHRDAVTEARAYVALHEKARADAAKVARVEALAERLSASPGDIMGVGASMATQIRAALADAPAEQRPMVYVDKETREPCPTSGKALCIIVDPDHLHVAQHMLPAEQWAEGGA
jgi:hypothetical protein